MTAARALTDSERDWLRVRRYLVEHRYQLAVDAAGDYPAARRVAGTPLLAGPGWQPAGPIPLRDLDLEFAPAGRAPPVHDAAPVLPERPDGTRYVRYWACSSRPGPAASAGISRRGGAWSASSPRNCAGTRRATTPCRSPGGWPPRSGRARSGVWCLRLGVDPLTYAADLLTVAVIDSRVLAAREFAARAVDRVVTGEPVQAAGAAVLRLAWRHRETLAG